MTLALIDRLGLYDTIFTDPHLTSRLTAQHSRWSTAYKLLAILVAGSTDSEVASWPVRTIQETLLVDVKERFVAWLLCALAPWANIGHPTDQSAGSKKPSPMLVIVARQGLKADNKTLRFVKAAAMGFGQVASMKCTVLDENTLPTLDMMRAQRMYRREAVGMKLRRLGPCWRSIVMFALLTDIMNTHGEAGK